MADFQHIFYIDGKRDTAIIPVGELTGLRSISSLEASYSCDGSDDVVEHISRHLVIDGADAAGKGGYAISGGIYKSGTYSLTHSSGRPESYMMCITFQKPYIRDIKLEFSVVANKAPAASFAVVLKSDVSNKPVYLRTGNIIGDKSATFMLARTNPKLTGNIKLVVDTSYGIYMDTFRASEVLSNNKYRHQPISSDGNFPRDVKRIFGTLPQQEMYRIDSDALDPHKCYVDYDMQYETMYEYGAETNNDMLYGENMRIFAPLRLGRDVPDFFCVFRVEKSCNAGSYDGRLDDTEVFRDMLKEGVCVQAYDLRPHTTIGQYLNNYSSMISDVSGSMFLQFIEQDRDPDSEDYSQKYKTGTNRWYGVSVDKGVLTSKIETSYNANKILEQSGRKQEDFDLFLLRGFERNNMICHDILNLEFMFNDEDADNYMVYNYYGLYLKANEFISYDHVINDYTSMEGNVEQRCAADGSAVDDQPFYKDIIDSGNYGDRIIMAITTDGCKHVKSGSDLDDFIYGNVANKVMSSICTMPSRQFSADGGSFVTVKFRRQIRYGEHFRLVDMAGGRVFEAVASNDRRLAGCKGCAHPYAQTNDASGTEVYRISFYSQDIEDPSAPAPLGEQLERLEHALRKLDSSIRIESRGADAISIVFASAAGDAWFEHILAPGAAGADEAAEDSLYYFTDNSPVEARPISHRDQETGPATKAFYPADFSATGIRHHSICSLISPKGWMWHMDGKLGDVTSAGRFMACSTAKGYRMLRDFEYEVAWADGKEFKTERHAINYAISPADVSGSLVLTDYAAVLFSNKLILYRYMKCDVCLMGMYGIKDFDMRIGWDSSTTHKVTAEMRFSDGDVLKFGYGAGRLRYNELYRLKSGHFSSSVISAGTSFYCEASGSGDRIVYGGGGGLASIAGANLVCDGDAVVEVLDYAFGEYELKAEEPQHQINSLYASKGDKASSLLTTPLCPQVCCFWESTGLYYDKVSTLSADQLVDKGYRKSLCGADSGTRGFCDVVQYKGNDESCKGHINNSIEDRADVSGEYVSFADIFSSGGMGIENPIRQYLLSNGNPELAKGYYNKYIDTFEFIYCGAKFTLKFTSKDYNIDVRLSEYNNYDVCVISDYNESLDNEIYVSTEEEIMLVINRKFDARAARSNRQYARLVGSQLAFADDCLWYKTKNPLDFSKIYGDSTSLYVRKTGELGIDGPVAALVQHDYLDSSKESFQEGDSYCCILENLSAPGYSLHETAGSLNAAYAGHPLWYRDSMLMNTSAADPHAMTSSLNAGGEKKDLLKNTYVYQSGASAAEARGGDIIGRFMDSFTDTFKFCAIRRGGEVYEVSNSDSYRPLSISASVPSRIKYNYGYFAPKFYDLIEFDRAEDDRIQELCGSSFLLNNTCFKKLSPISNYYCAKVFDDVKKKKIAANYYCLPERSLVGCLWDKGVYRRYTDEDAYASVDGYIPGIEDRMFLGSTCLVLNHPSIRISKWDYGARNSTVKTSTAMSGHNKLGTQAMEQVIELNLTNALYGHVTGSEEFRVFVNQWSVFPGSSSTAISNYINNTLGRKYFKLTDKSAFKLYVKTEGQSNKSLDLRYDEPADFRGGAWRECANFESEYSNINNEIVLVIRLSDCANAAYYPVLVLER